MAKSVKWLEPRGPERWLQRDKMQQYNEAITDLVGEANAGAWRAIGDRWASVGMVLAMRAPSVLKNLHALLAKHNGFDLSGEVFDRFLREVLFLIALGEALGAKGVASIPRRDPLKTLGPAFVYGWWFLEGQARAKAGQDEVPSWDWLRHPATAQMLQATGRAFDTLRDRQILEQVVAGDTMDRATAPVRCM